MVYMLLGLITAVLSFSSAAYGDNPPNSGSGIVRHGKEKLDSVKGNGRVTLKETQVKDDVTVNGSLWARKASIGSVDVGGHAYLEKSTVFGPTKVSGFFSAKDTTFKKQLEVTAQKISLERCDVDSILVHKTHVPFFSQVVELNRHSVCRGKIVFESGKGKVVLHGKSRMKGKIEGGKLEVSKS